MPASTEKSKSMSKGALLYKKRVKTPINFNDFSNFNLNIKKNLKVDNINVQKKKVLNSPKDPYRSYYSTLKKSVKSL